MVNSGIEKIKEQVKIPDFFNPDIDNVELEGFSIYEKKDTVLSSLIFGIEIKWVAIVGAIYFLVFKK